MKFTELKFCENVKPIVVRYEKQVDKVPVSLDRSKKLAPIMTNCYKEVVQELDKWVKIYLDEEGQYCEFIKSLLDRTSQISASMRKTTDGIGTDSEKAKLALNDFVLQQKTLDEAVEAAEEAGKGLTAHQTFRGNDPFVVGDVQKIAAKSLGTNYEKVVAYYKSQRAPAIQWVADVKKEKMKLIEYKKRGEDCVTTAKSLLVKGGQAKKETLEEVTKLLQEVEIHKGRIDSLLKDRGAVMDKLIEAAQSKQKPDDKAMKAHETYVVSIPDQVAKLKMQLKTLSVAAGNLDQRMKKHASMFDLSASKALKDTIKLLTEASETIKSNLVPKTETYQQAWKTFNP